MKISGAFGYKIGKKTRLMRIDCNTDIIWQLCIKELYILMKHYGTIERLTEQFKNLKDAQRQPTRVAIEKCKYFTNKKEGDETLTWESITSYCQSSYINILKSCYFLNNGMINGPIILLDFNTNTLKYFYKDGKTGQEKVVQSATIEEIMEYEDMPSISMDEILDEMICRYEIFETKQKSMEEEIIKTNTIIKKTNEMGADQNIITKAKKMMDTLLWDKKKVELEYKFMFRRCEILDININ